MRQRESLRPIVAPGGHCLGHTAERPTQMVCLRVAPEYKGQTNFGQLIKDWSSPRRRTFGSGRIVSRPTPSREAKPHGQNGDTPRIVEHGLADSHPLSQPDSAGILEGDPRNVDSVPWGLSRDQNSGV
jgi:hypothetical protein